MAEERATKPHRAMSRRSFLGGALVAAAGLFGGATVANTYHFEVSRHRAALPGLKAPLRLVQLSDLHFGPYIQAGSLRAWVEATMAESADLIVLTGDFVDSALAGDLTPLARALSELHAPLGVWGVWGNHDYGRFADIEVLETPLRQAGVRMLANQGARPREDLFLAGVDELRKRIRQTLRQQPENTASIMLLHNPLVFFNYDIPALAGLTLCGHTHGGQVRLPVVGPLFMPERYDERFIDGWVDSPNPIYISRGLGVSVLPLRLNCPAELAVFDLEPSS